jgi:sn-glycerol 3-phosphate transport system ATP-binding protein
MRGIELAGVSKAWGGAHAVKDVTFTAEPGSLTVLLGPSGCGKSTTLRLIAGLDEMTSGTILIDGRNVSDLPPSRRGLAMVFQSYALFPHLSVAENIIFGLRVRRLPRAERDERLRMAADLLGLAALLERKPSQLSGGQQQRVALGRAIVARAPICLMDEPLSNLDAQLRHEMRREIRDLQQKLAMTMVYVTHDQIEAMSMADRVVLLRSGHIEQNATPEELYTCPATTFAASFIGTPPMNLLRLVPGADGAVIEGTTGPALHAGSGQPLLLGLRPEHVAVDERGRVECQVASAEYHGADSILTCRIGSQTLQVRHGGPQRVVPGARVNLAWAPEAMHFFDAATGLRVPALRASVVELA